MNQPYQVGDHVSIAETVHRPWWKLWAPKEAVVSHTYICTQSSEEGAMGREGVMTFFAWQHGPSGDRVPVAFAEHPKDTPSMACDLIKGTLRPIPAELQHASLAELVEWDEGKGAQA